MKEFGVLKGLVTNLLLLDMKEIEECDTILSEIKFLISFQIFFKSFRLSLKSFVK